MFRIQDTRIVDTGYMEIHGCRDTRAYLSIPR